MDKQSLEPEVINVLQELADYDARPSTQDVFFAIELAQKATLGQWPVAKIVEMACFYEGLNCPSDQELVRAIANMLHDEHVRRTVLPK